MNRKALVVGINYYQHGSPLYGCVDDAHDVKAVIARHGDGSVNFDVQLFTGTGPSEIVTRANLKDYATKLFSDDSEIALFFFAGHGHIESTGGYLLASDSSRGDEGLALRYIRSIAFIYGVVIFCCIITGCGIPEPYEVSPGVYAISKQDYAGAFGNAQKMKADVIRKANSFATKQGMVAVPAGSSFTPMGGGPAEFASIDYRFYLMKPSERAILGSDISEPAPQLKPKYEPAIRRTPAPAHTPAQSSWR